MKPANILFAAAAVAALTGCSHIGTMFSHKPGQTVRFVSANPASVLVDYGARPDGELTYADAMAKDKCALFGKESATLESLNPVSEGRIRATYLCK